MIYCIHTLRKLTNSMYVVRGDRDKVRYVVFNKLTFPGIYLPRRPTSSSLRKVVHKSLHPGHRLLLYLLRCYFTLFCPFTAHFLWLLFPFCLMYSSKKRKLLWIVVVLHVYLCFKPSNPRFDFFLLLFLEEQWRLQETV